MHIGQLSPFLGQLYINGSLLMQNHELVVELCYYYPIQQFKILCTTIGNVKNFSVGVNWKRDSFGAFLPQLRGIDVLFDVTIYVKERLSCLFTVTFTGTILVSTSARKIVIISFYV